MHWRSITRLFGILLTLYSISFLPSAAVSLWYDDGHGCSTVVIAGHGGYRPAAVAAQHPAPQRIVGAEGFLVVTLFWWCSACSARSFIAGLHLT
jgi:trk system potassium uptake protein TrkH